jgi:membrane peptidoglycan carboxypeptidase
MNARATGSGSGRRRPTRRADKNTYTTKSGKSIKLNQSFSDRMRSKRNNRAERKAVYLSTLPKDRMKRILYRLHPKRVLRYWFSREGGIMALKITGVAIVVVFFLAVGLFAYFRKDLPKITNLAGDKLGGSITYYDRTGQTVLWQDYGAVKRVPVSTDNISPYMKEATVAIEDKDFYKHGAFDVRGILRAGVHDFTGGGGTQGGSTITQQLVKLNENWTTDHTITRKVKELILAVELEREYSKSDILTGYLNIAPYGGVEYGVETAARDYFGISAKDLSLAQAAMLASIPKAPTSYSPYSDPTFNSAATENLFDKPDLLARQQYILNQMAKQGMITQKQADDAKKVDVIAQVKPLQPLYNGIRAPYFVLAAKQQLQQQYGAATVQRGGWKVITTLDLSLQTTAEDLVAKNLPNVSRYGGDEEATVAEDVQTGQIVALVGGTNFSDPDHGQNNFAAGIQLPPGSSFKPYDYATFINNNTNVGAGSVLYDTQGPLPGYPCTNKAVPLKGGNCLEDYDFLNPGPITLRYAIGGSRNIPAVKAMLSAVPNDKSSGHVDSVNKVISTASAMMYNPNTKGNTYNCYSDEALTQTTQCYGASAIGDGAFLHLDDHVNGLSTLARMGVAIPKTYILKITDAGGKNVPLVTYPSKQVLKPDSAYILNDMASDPNASYLPGSCTATTCTSLAHGGYKFQRDNGSHFAVKTGTTNDGYDGLMTSWSSKYAVVSWVGNHTRHVTLNTTLENLTEPLTRGMMEAAQAGKPVSTFTAPADIKTLPAFIVRNHIHYGDIEPSPANDLFPSWYQSKSAAVTNQTVDKVSNKLATSCTPDDAKQTNTNGNATSWNVDIFVGGSSSSTAAATGNDDVHNCGDATPTVTVTAPPECDPPTGCTVTATVTQGTHALTDPAYPNYSGTVTFSVAGQVIKSFSVTDSPSTISFTYIPTTTGAVTITAQVTDSVLYQSTGTATVTAAAAPATTTTPTNGNNTQQQQTTGNGH